MQTCKGLFKKKKRQLKNHTLDHSHIVSKYAYSDILTDVDSFNSYFTIPVIYLIIRNPFSCLP